MALNRGEPPPEETASATGAAGTGEKFLIVGYTDNRGACGCTRKFSTRHAGAVTDTLTCDSGIPAAALSVGVGMAAPAATGRAKNRRVESVAM